jgi:hypothetical protein
LRAIIALKAAAEAVFPPLVLQFGNHAIRSWAMIVSQQFPEYNTAAAPEENPGCAGNRGTN